MGLIEQLRRRQQRRDALVDITDTSLKPAFGRPTRCPDCGGFGYVDHLDLIDRIQYQHCRACGYKWQVTEEELVA